MKTSYNFLVVVFSLAFMYFSAIYAQNALPIESQTIQSKVLLDNKIGINTKRDVKIMLPVSYAKSQKKYPVVYYLHNTFDSHTQVIEEFSIDSILFSAFTDSLCKEFILVLADFSSPTIGSMYENSPTSGKWLDYIMEELIDCVDSHYRTLNNPQSRAAVGFFFGGLGALKLGMLYPEKFGVVYAMHPVGTGSGYLPRSALEVNWEAIHNAKSYEELQGTGRTQIFASICQAFLPNSNRPPLYCDFLFEYDQDGNLILNAENVRKEQSAFHLDESLDQHIANLQRLSALAFDWARFDPTQAHVIANRRLSKLLMDINVAHEGEEYVGNPWNSYWTNNNRFITRVLPFLNNHLLAKENL